MGRGFSTGCYIWLAQLGTGSGPSYPWASRVTALLYGIGAALTLDEFALWLHLEDVYWSPEGRESIKSVNRRPKLTLDRRSG
jgi:hypothetical protein